MITIAQLKKAKDTRYSLCNEALLHVTSLAKYQKVNDVAKATRKTKCLENLG